MPTATLEIVAGRVRIVTAFTDPTSISGLRFQLKSSALTGFADGAAISSWPGSVGGINGDQPTASRRPVKQTVGGNAVARFSTDDVLNVDISLTTKSTTYVKYANRTGTNGSLFGGTSIYHDYAARSLTPFQRNTQIFHSDNTGGSITPSGGASLNASTRLIAAYDYDADQYEIFLDGVSRGTANTAVAIDTVSLVAIGTGYGEFLSGDIFEIGQYDRKLSSTEIADLDSYLVATYGA